MGDIVVAEGIHELPGAGAALGEELAERFAEAVRGAALRQAGLFRQVRHAAGGRLRGEGLAIGCEQHSVTFAW